MKAETLAAMARPGVAIAFDTETHLITDGVRYPPLVCASIAVLQPDGTIAGELLDKGQALAAFVAILQDPSRVMVCVNGAFDLGVMAVFASRGGVDLMSLIFDALDAGRIFDVQIAEELHHIGIGSLGDDPRTGAKLRDPETDEICRYRLSVVVDLVLGRTNAKDRDEWRLRYAELDGIPLSMWPSNAREYPIDDAANTLETALAQCGHRPNVGPHVWPAVGYQCVRCRAPSSTIKDNVCTAIGPRMNLHDLGVQVYKAFALDLGAAWGVRADPAAVEFLIETVEESRAALIGPFIDAGFVRNDEKNSENQGVVKRAVAIAYGASVRCAAGCDNGRFYKYSAKDPTIKLKSGSKECEHCSGTGVDVSSATIPKTKGGDVSAKRDVLNESGDDFLMDYAFMKETVKIRRTGAYGKFLIAAALGVVTLKPNALLETARVSYSGVVQTLPRAVSAGLAEALRKRRKLKIDERNAAIAARSTAC